MVAAHEIFEKPFKVELQYDEVATPENYRRYPDGIDLPESMKVWRVHPDKLPQTNWGLVSDGFGFTDSPDCEFISSGINSKGPNSVALGRQGNWFLWGFCAAPSEMTEAGRRTFLNTIVYMKRFAGNGPLVTQPVKARRWVYVFAKYLGEEEERIRDIAKRFIDEKIRSEGSEDPAKLIEFLHANEGWLRYVVVEAPESRPESKPVRQYKMVIDEDARAIGVRNDDPMMLDRCITMLEKGDRPDLAQRVLERYTDQKHGADAKAWRAWFDANRSRLYFTDTGGYRFKIRPDGLR